MMARSTARSLWPRRRRQPHTGKASLQAQAALALPSKAGGIALLAKPGTIIKDDPSLSPNSIAVASHSPRPPLPLPGV